MCLTAIFFISFEVTVSLKLLFVRPESFFHLHTYTLPPDGFERVLRQFRW